MKPQKRHGKKIAETEYSQDDREYQRERRRKERKREEKQKREARFHKEFQHDYDYEWQARNRGSKYFIKPNIEHI